MVQTRGWAGSNRPLQNFSQEYAAGQPSFEMDSPFRAGGVLKWGVPVALVALS